MNEEKIVVYTFRYIWKDKQGKMCVKYLTDTAQAHVNFIEKICKSDEVESCVREYVHEIDLEQLGRNEVVKKKEDKQ